LEILQITQVLDLIKKMFASLISLSEKVEQEADIRIVDVNDNSPRFTRDRYVARIPEDAPVGTEVIRVSASDPDTGMGGSVRYLLEVGKMNRHQCCFGKGNRSFVFDRNLSKQFRTRCCHKGCRYINFKNFQHLSNS